MRIPARFDLTKAGTSCLVHVVEPSGPTEISALMVLAFDSASRDVLIATSTDFMSAFDARFHCRS